jgi:hypothetical protein
MPHAQPMAIPWYESQSDYDFIFSMLTAKGTKDTVGFRGYLSDIEHREKDLQRGGFVTFRIIIKASAVKAWCETHKTSLTADALNAFMLEKLKDIHEGSGSN